jgi:predicted component of type VI protein secretion system
VATTEAREHGLHFRIPAGEGRNLRVPVGFGPEGGDRVRVKLRSLLGPGVAETRRRTLVAENG